MILFVIVLCSLVGVLGCIFDYQLQKLDKRILNLEKRVELLEQRIKELEFFLLDYEGCAENEVND